MRAVPSIWPQHFYSGPSLARDDRVESRACNLGWTPKEEVWSHRCTKTCLTLQSPSLCKVMSPGSACFLGSFDPPWAQTCLLPSEPVNPQLKKFDEKMLFISEWWTLFTFLFCSPFQQDDKVQSRPCNFGRDRKKCLEFGSLGCCSRRNMFVTSVQTTYNQAGLVRTMFSWVVSVCNRFLLGLEFDCIRSVWLVNIFGQKSSWKLFQLR